LISNPRITLAKDYELFLEERLERDYIKIVFVFYPKSIILAIKDGFHLKIK